MHEASTIIHVPLDMTELVKRDSDTNNRQQSTLNVPHKKTIIAQRINQETNMTLDL